MRTRIRALLRSERGNYLANSMVGSFISLLVLGVVATGIYGAGTFQGKIAVRSSVSNQASSVDSALRTDLTWASKIEAVDSSRLVLTVPGTQADPTADAGCRISEWVIEDNADGNKQLVNTVTTYSSYNPNTNPVSCAGDASTPNESIVVKDAAMSSSFRYHNAGGRELIFQDSALKPTAAGPAPAGVIQAVWASNAVTEVRLKTEIGTLTDVATTYEFIQAAPNLSVVNTGADWSSHFVQKGSLTQPASDTLALNYSGATSFNAAATNQSLSPTITGGTGSNTFTVQGDLPEGVTFDSSTGRFTGKPTWNPQIQRVSAGNGTSCGLEDSRVFCWGVSTYGQLGNGTTTASPGPVEVSGLAGKKVTALSNGSNHSCVIADDAAYCWGHNGNGKLGDGSLTSRYTATRVAGPLLDKTVSDISAGYRNTCAIANGQAYCWGEGAYGALGNGSSTDSTLPVLIDHFGAIAGQQVTDISVGSLDHACAVAGGRAFCWGSLNSVSPANNGMLGDGGTTGSATPVAVSTTGVLSGKTVTAVSVGTKYSCAVASGQAVCWGQGLYGKLGNRSTVDSPVPVAVDTTGVLAGRTIETIDAGYNHACVTASGSGAVSCWGHGGYGQLGDGALSSRSYPVDANVSTTGLTAGNGITCSTAAGAVQCWGYGAANRLGNGTVDNSSVPVNPTGLTGNPGFPAPVTVNVKSGEQNTRSAITLQIR